MNWGYKIVMIYVLFVAGIIFMVFKSATQTVDLVTSDYYEQELVYQDKIDQAGRAAKLSSDLLYTINAGNIDIVFPEEMHGKNVQADVMLYCPSDKRKDLARSFNTNDGQLQFGFPKSYNGQFEVKVNWKVDGITYYSSNKMFIQ